jgi:hypothetical protein
MDTGTRQYYSIGTWYWYLVVLDGQSPPINTAEEKVLYASLTTLFGLFVTSYVIESMGTSVDSIMTIEYGTTVVDSYCTPE